MTFFQQQQAAAVLKHGILKRYLPVFVNKTGSQAGEVAYIDCYAGPGQYEDGSDGSPALALATAQAVAKARGRASLSLHLIEKNRKQFDQLGDFLDRHDVGAEWVAHHGSAKDVVPEILRYDLKPRTPVFAFIDPFGLPIPFDTVIDIMKRGRTSGRVGAPTEVLLNFTLSGIRRNAGQLDARATMPANKKAAATTVRTMNNTMGGEWWQSIWRSEAEDRVDQIRSEYSRRLLENAPGGWAFFDIDVSDRWQGPVSYHLLLFTQHRDGIWAFHEALSSAQEEYRTYCHGVEGLLELEPLEERAAKWVAHIEENVERILREEEKFKPVLRIDRVFGDAFGEAREKHLRTALRNLKRASLISTDPKGQLANLWIHR
jgi:three-Cys-motif partner protein